MAGVRAVVFDLDGVLIDSEGVWDRIRRELVAERGGSWEPDASRRMLGMSAGEWSAFMHEQIGVPLEPEAINAEVVERVLAAYRVSLPLLPGAVEAVGRLAAVWPLGLASSSNRIVIEEVLADAGLSGHFQVTVSSEEVPRGKPHADVYEAAVEQLGVPAASTVAIEDSANGIRSAAAAGMHVIAIPNREFPPAAQALASADLCLASAQELSAEAVAALL